MLGYPIKSSYTGDWKGFYYILIKSLKQFDISLLNDAFISSASDGNNLAIKVLLF